MKDRAFETSLRFSFRPPSMPYFFRLAGKYMYRSAMKRLRRSRIQAAWLSSSTIEKGSLASSPVKRRLAWKAVGSEPVAPCVGREGEECSARERKREGGRGVWSRRRRGECASQSGLECCVQHDWERSEERWGERGSLRQPAPNAGWSEVAWAASR